MLLWVILMTSEKKNTTEAPISAATTRANDFSKEKISIKQLDFITLMSQFYNIKGRLMTSEEAIKDFHFDLPEFTELIKDDRVQKALQERGVVQRRLAVVKEVDSDKSDSVDNSVETNQTALTQEALTWKDKTLLPEQLIVANTMLNLIDGRSRKKKLQDLGISNAKFIAWMKDPIFYEYMRARSEEMLKENGYEAHLALLDKVNMGDMSAIKYYNELTDRYKEQAAALNKEVVAQVDYRSIIVSIVEIINDEVTDPEMAMSISEKIKGLINANSVASQLIESQIIQPTVMPARELTPGLTKLMESGEGYE